MFIASDHLLLLEKKKKLLVGSFLPSALLLSLSPSITFSETKQNKTNRRPGSHSPFFLLAYIFSVLYLLPDLPIEVTSSKQQ